MKEIIIFSLPKSKHQFFHNFYFNLFIDYWTISLKLGQNHKIIYRDYNLKINILWVHFIFDPNDPLIDYMTHSFFAYFIKVVIISQTIHVESIQYHWLVYFGPKIVGAWCNNNNLHVMNFFGYSIPYKINFIFPLSLIFLLWVILLELDQKKKWLSGNICGTVFVRLQDQEWCDRS